MKNISSATIATLVLATTLTACNSKEDKSSAVSAEFYVTGSGQDAVAYSPFMKALDAVIPKAHALTPPPLEDANGTAVTLNDAWIVLKKIQFKSEETDENGGEDNVLFHGPFFVDLLSDTPTAFGTAEFSPVGLRRVKMLLHKATNGEKPAGAPASLTGNSIYLAGAINGHDLSFEADDTTDFSISGANAVYPEKGADFLAVIRIADLFKKIDLSGINADTAISASNRVPTVAPCPQIHATASDLYTCFRMGIALEAKFGKDGGDRDLDSQDETVGE